MNGHLPENELGVSPQSFPRKLGRVSKGPSQRPKQSEFMRAPSFQIGYFGPFIFCWEARMLQRLLLSTVCLSLFACGPKESSSTGTPAQAAATMHDGVPADGTSQSFAKKLTRLTISNFRPEDTGGLKLKYLTLEFRTDGSWTAGASMTDPFDEASPCTEAGTWTMEAAESATAATVTWSLQETNCMARSAGGEIRAKLVIGKGGSVEAFNR